MTAFRTLLSQLHTALLLVFTILLAMVSTTMRAQTATSPTVTPQMTYTNADGQQVQENSYNGGAPLIALFSAKIEQLGNYTPLYEWQFLRENNSIPFLTRYAAATNYEFRESGNFRVRLLISFVLGSDTISYTQDDPFTLNIAESKLEFPNAFTPNGDGINDIFKAKDGYQSIISFRADVVNRWGKRVAQWTNPADGWDGRHGGSEAPEGAYYLNVTARGADGRNYNVKKTINLLRRYDATTK